MYVRTRHRRTLQRIATPTPSDIRRAEIESMLRAAGVEVSDHERDPEDPKEGPVQRILDPKQA